MLVGMSGLAAAAIHILLNVFQTA
ncbi:hypothetical protein HaLaN_16968 [Haematococcus lacustris]|uniref:Uncharacterized protein n=1 Tax=Haematococcus lacustris TaxID=44745 RepID=A0A699ZME6_HAELA|nr:hypothetical protein HaLaN_16968 [Haematococcus lacustris]